MDARLPLLPVTFLKGAKAGCSSSNDTATGMAFEQSVGGYPCPGQRGKDSSQETPIDGQMCASGVGSGIGEQKGNRFGNLVATSYAPHGNVLPDLLRLLATLMQHGRLDDHPVEAR